MSLFGVRDLQAQDLPAGTTLTRTYLGEVFVVEIAQVGYNPNRSNGTLTKAERRRKMWRYWYKGVRWRTLSAIAFEITGDRYHSGNRFFGLSRSRRSK